MKVDSWVRFISVYIMDLIFYTSQFWIIWDPFLASQQKQYCCYWQRAQREMADVHRSWRSLSTVDGLAGLDPTSVITAQTVFIKRSWRKPSHAGSRLSSRLSTKTIGVAAYRAAKQNGT